ncbi:MAG: SWIM zinc finger family protein [Geobacteraceae bacterium]|jgi:hypothetical protein
MDELRFLVQGSAEAPYRVTFQKNGNNLSAYCTCPAGNNGQYCKHRFNIISGITDGIVSNNEQDVKIVESWLPGTDVEDALNEVMDAEEQFEKAKHKLSSAKKRLAGAFRD